MNSKWIEYNSEADGKEIIDMAMDIVKSSKIEMELRTLKNLYAQPMIEFCGHKGAATVRYSYYIDFDDNNNGEIDIGQYQDVHQYRPCEAEVVINTKMLRKTLKGIITMHTI